MIGSRIITYLHIYEHFMYVLETIHSNLYKVYESVDVIIIIIIRIYLK